MNVLGLLAGTAERRIGALMHPLTHLHHRRTLRRGSVGAEEERQVRSAWWGDDQRWFPGGTPPRLHNRVTPLIDGAAFLTELQAALGRAQSYVYVAGWCLTPGLPLQRGSRQVLIDKRLLSVFSAAAERVPVRVLIWGGARAVLHPTRADMEDVVRAFQTRTGGDLICRLDNTAHFSHCHHQKAIVIDGQVAFVGGMDLTTFQGDRWDVPGHPLRAGPNWHDVQLKLEGELVSDVEHNFRQRWQDSCRSCFPPGVPEELPHRDPASDQAWETPAQVVRTIAHHVYESVPRGEFGIYHVYLEALRRARRFIYVENQYLWAPEVMEVLLDHLQRPPSARFRIVIVLPAGAHSGKWDNDQHVKELRAADGGRGIVFVYSLYASGPSAGVHAFRYRPVYVHAKVAVIDDEWLTVGSANLNDRGLVTDSEMNVVVKDPALATGLRTDLWAEHLALPRDEVARADPIELIDRAWTGRAAENATIRRRRDRGNRPLVCGVHSYETGGVPISWLLDEAEALTFEH
ncbi:MAG: phospholipase D-like domain-containing protein [Dehalococcoidia bacterium]